MQSGIVCLVTYGRLPYSQEVARLLPYLTVYFPENRNGTFKGRRKADGPLCMVESDIFSIKKAG